MSLYNLVCGNNPLYYLWIVMAGVRFESIPRFRDCYLTVENEKPLLVLYTRSGGGNREWLAKENTGLRSLPNYVRDHDCDYDGTFAHWYYSMPVEHEDTLLRLTELLPKHSKFLPPRDKTKIMLGEQDPPPGLSDKEAEEVSTLLHQLMEAYEFPQPPTLAERK